MDPDVACASGSVAGRSTITARHVSSADTLSGHPGPVAHDDDAQAGAGTCPGDCTRAGTDSCPGGCTQADARSCPGRLTQASAGPRPRGDAGLQRMADLDRRLGTDHRLRHTERHRRVRAGGALLQLLAGRRWHHLAERTQQLRLLVLDRPADRQHPDRHPRPGRLPVPGGGPRLRGAAGDLLCRSHPQRPDPADLQGFRDLFHLRRPHLTAAALSSPRDGKRTTRDELLSDADVSSGGVRAPASAVTRSASTRRAGSHQARR